VVSDCLNTESVRFRLVSLNLRKISTFTSILTLKRTFDDVSFIFGYETRHRSFKIPNLEAHGRLWRFAQAGLTPTNPEFVRISPSLCKTAITALKKTSLTQVRSVAQGQRDAHLIYSARRLGNAQNRTKTTKFGRKWRSSAENHQKVPNMSSQGHVRPNMYAPIHFRPKMYP